MIGVDGVYMFGMEVRFFGVSFSRQFRTPGKIVRRVLGVWVLHFPTYFNCCPFFLDIPNFWSSLGDQLVFMSSKANLSATQV